ncbi:hypothetical protein APHAL10511_002280 [Amanita phalloides]|nr:hypothetical protein APHAL10511_002280 [Amanita phalloides]
MYASDPPTKLLSIPFYFASPLNTLLDSMHDPDYNQITLHDVMEAYACFSDRIRSVAKPLMGVETTRTEAAFRIVGERSVELAWVLKRDLRRALAAPPSHSQDSLHMYSYSPTLDDDAQYALDSARLAQYALCFISDICIFRALYSLFSSSDFQSILDEVFAFTVAPELAILNGSKLCCIIVWILQVQQLPAEILLTRVDQIVLTLKRAIKGYFGPQAVLDGLKTVHTLLLRRGVTLLRPLVTLLPFVLEHIVSDSLDLRLSSVYALSGFAFAVNACKEPCETCGSIRQTTQAFVERHFEKPGNILDAASLPNIVQVAASNRNPTHLGQGPGWALTFVSSMIILWDYTIFFRPYCVKFCFSTLFQAAHHKRSIVRTLHSHVWKLLIWAYLRIPDAVDKGELGDVEVADIKRRSFKVLRQETKTDIATAFVASLLQDGRTLTVVHPLDESLENALGIVRDMLRSLDSDTRRVGVSLFNRLLGSSYESNAGLSEHHINGLRCQMLFDGTLLDGDLKRQSGVVQSIPNITPELVRQLTNEEIYESWKPIVSVWAAAALVSLKESESALSDFVLSIWISLLEIFVQRCDGLTPTSSPSGLSSTVAIVAGQLLDASGEPDAQIRHLQFVKKVWSMTKSVLYDTWLPSNAEIILAAVLKRPYTLSDDGVKKVWSDLCADLISVGVPTLLHIIYFQSERREQVEVLRQLWTVLIRTWQIIDHGTTWDDLVTLLVVPFGTWRLSTEEAGMWESLLNNAVKLAGRSSASGNAVVRIFAERLGDQRREGFKANAQAVYSIVRQLDLSGCKELDTSLFELVDDVLIKFYPPLPELLSTCIDILCVVGELFASCPDILLPDLIKITQGSLCCWIQDEEGVLLDTEQNIIVNAVYCTALDRLCYLEPTTKLLHDIAPFLVSVFKAKHIPGPALGPSSFETFWRMSYHEKKELQELWPEEIKTCLESLSLAWGESVAGSFSVSQKSRTFVPDSQAIVYSRSTSAQAFTPLSSPFDPFLSPQRRSSAPPCSPSNLSITDNAQRQEPSTPRPRGDHSGATPTNLHRPSGLSQFALSSDNILTSTPCADVEAASVGLFKGRKRVVPSEHFKELLTRKRQRFEASLGLPVGSSPLRNTIPSVQRASSEPLLEQQSLLVTKNRSISQPKPSRKRKLADYVDMPWLRNVRSRLTLDSLPEISNRLIEGLSLSKLPNSGMPHGERVAHLHTVASTSDKVKINAAAEPDDFSRPLPLLYTPATPQRAQSLPIVEDERVPEPKNLTAMDRLTILRNALTAVVETDGISQISDQDLIDASNQIGALVSERNSRKLVKSGNG